MEVKNKQTQVSALNLEIAERRKYYRTQEALIADTIESGNMELLALNHEILVARKTLRELKTDIRTAVQDKVLLNQDLGEMRVEMHRLTIVHMPMANGFA